MLEKEGDFKSCALGYTISLLKAKWEPYIVWYLDLMPSKRAGYSELRKAIPYDLSHKMLIQHLGKLEDAGVVERIVTDTKPLRVDYALTEKGASFANVLAFLRDWGSVYGDFSNDVVLRSKGTRKDDFVMFGHPEKKDDRLGGGDCILWYMKGFSDYYKPPKIGKDAAPKSGDADAPAEDFQDASAQEPQEATQEAPAQTSAEA